MKGPDFEFPPFGPESSEDDVLRPKADVPSRHVNWRVGLAAVLVSTVLAAFVVFWVSSKHQTTEPNALGPAPSLAPTVGTLPRARPPSSVATTALPARAARTCIESQGDPRPLEERPSSAAAPSVVLRVSPQVSTQALELIAHAVADAIATFGGTDALAVVVHCSLDDYVDASNRSPEDVRQRFSGGLPAQVLNGDIWIYGPNFDRPSLNQRRVVYHEYFHALQRFLSAGRFRDAPLWLVEGTARYFEFSVAPGDLESFRRTQLRRWSNLPPLAALEETGGGKAIGGGGEAYNVGAVASEYLVAKYGRDRLQHDLWVALAETDWRSAFMHVFGIPVDAFYTEFEEYRRTLRP